MFKRVSLFLLLLSAAFGTLAAYDFPVWASRQLGAGLTFTEDYPSVSYTMKNRVESGDIGKDQDVIVRDYRISTDAEGEIERTLLRSTKNGDPNDEEDSGRGGGGDVDFYPPNEEYRDHYEFSVVSRNNGILTLEYQPLRTYRRKKGYGTGLIRLNIENREVLEYSYTPVKMPFGLSEFGMTLRFTTTDGIIYPEYSLLEMQVSVLFVKKRIYIESVIEDLVSDS